MFLDLKHDIESTLLINYFIYLLLGVNFVYLDHRFSELLLIHFNYQLANFMVRHSKGPQENS